MITLLLSVMGPPVAVARVMVPLQLNFTVSFGAALAITFRNVPAARCRRTHSPCRWPPARPRAAPPPGRLAARPPRARAMDIRNASWFRPLLCRVCAHVATRDTAQLAWMIGWKGRRDGHTCLLQF